MHEIHPNTLKKLNEIIGLFPSNGFVPHAFDANDFAS
jgi:hypothetical protein